MAFREKYNALCSMYSKFPFMTLRKILEVLLFYDLSATVHIPTRSTGSHSTASQYNNTTINVELFTMSLSLYWGKKKIYKILWNIKSKSEK